MTLSRRLLLKAASVLPLAPKDVVQTEAMKLAGIEVARDPSGFGQEIEADNPWTGDGEGKDNNKRLRARATVAAIKSGMVPPEILQYLTLSERNPYEKRSNLDPDIASLRSFSLCGKIQEQRRRDREMRLERMVEDFERNEIEKVLSKTLGIYIG